MNTNTKSLYCTVDGAIFISIPSSKVLSAPDVNTLPAGISIVVEGNEKMVAAIFVPLLPAIYAGTVP